jgi:ferrous iron transport protein B
VIGAFFSGYGRVEDGVVKGAIMLACYLLGIVAAALTSLACRWLLGRGEVSPFILEMPSYKVPQASEVARQVWSNTRQFLTKAGTTIFCLSVLLWALAYFPRLPSDREAQIRAQAGVVAGSVSPAAQAPAATVPIVAAGATHPATVAGAASAHAGGDTAKSPEAGAPAAAEGDDAVAAEQLAYSWAGRLGHAIEPAIAPLGFDWKMGVGLVAAFAAREVFVSTMGIVYSVGESEDNKTRIQEAMLKDRRADGRLVWSPVVAISLLVWFVLAMQCISTFAVVRRETGGWSWPVFQLVYMNALAYVASLVTYQVGIRLVS